MMAIHVVTPADHAELLKHYLTPGGDALSCLLRSLESARDDLYDREHKTAIGEAADLIEGMHAALAEIRYDPLSYEVPNGHSHRQTKNGSRARRRA